jgi:hypothetical protein
VSRSAPPRQNRLRAPEHCQRAARLGTRRRRRALAYDTAVRPLGCGDDRRHDSGKVALIPTLKLWIYELRHERVTLQDRFVDTAVGQLRAWNAAGGAVLFGTDVGSMSDYDTDDEFALMARAGMTTRQTIASLTTPPAKRFGATCSAVSLPG